MKSKRLIVIVGPTAVGKTGLAIRLARQLETEIISADSRQIFKELEIGTAKPTLSDLQQVRHYFVGTRSIYDDYNAGQFGRDALITLREVFERHDRVIACGGSGLYIKALCEGFDEMPNVTQGIRDEIMKEYSEKGLTWLQQQVEESDPDYFSVVDQKNPHRLIRALELYRSSGLPVRQLRQAKKVEREFDILKIGLELERHTLFDRIDLRMDAMIDAGLFAEAEQFYHKKELNALQTVGYQEIFGFMDGSYDKEEAIRLLKRNSRRYAKRQLTWFKKDKTIQWFRPNQYDEIYSLATLAASDEK